jgi:hypothetical protein
MDQMRRNIVILKGAAGALFCFCLVPACAEGPAGPSWGGWGVDACLTALADPPARAAYLPQLRAAGITILRERGPNPAMAELHGAGFRVVSFLGLGPLPIEQPSNTVPEDLLAVFSAAKAMQRLHGRYVDAWEMVGEPDVGYCPDLPDRVAAFQKAVYLGIKAGAEQERRKAEGERRKAESGKADIGNAEGGRQTTDGGGQLTESERRKAEREKAEIGNGEGGTTDSADHLPERVGAGHTSLVLMGALALPPGPWLERAARNGLLDYTDAYNFHFYGFAEDLTGVIRAHEAFAMKWVDLRTRTIVGSDPLSGPRECGRSAGERRPYRSAETPSPDPLADARGHDDHLGPGHTSEGFPIWITECGLNAVTPDDFLNPARRQMQADFTLTTAKGARASDNVAVFMPFILMQTGDPYALTLAPDRPLPAWEAYAGYSRRHPFPSRMLAMPPSDPNPIVVQWMPDNRTTVPHKVSGTYRFLEGQSIRGVLRIYNLGEESMQGRLEGGALRHVRLESRDLCPVEPTLGGAGDVSELPVSEGSTRTHGQDARATQAQVRGQAAYATAERRTMATTVENSGQPAFRSSGLTIPALGRVDLPVTFAPNAAGYFREFWEASFLDVRDGRSPVCFGLESMPSEDDLVAVPFELSLEGHGMIGHPELDGASVTSESGAWTGINGLVVETERFESESRSQNPKQQVGGAGKPLLLRASVTECISRLSLEQAGKPALLPASIPNQRQSEEAPAMTTIVNDPLRPTMAIARVRGLPPHGFLHLQLDRPMDASFRVRVDLVDRSGQRFTIWENCGASYFEPRDEAWLNLDDFHVYFWGRCSENPVFRPKDVDQIRLRFYFSRANDPRMIQLSLWQPRGEPVFQR